MLILIRGLGLSLGLSMGLSMGLILILSLSLGLGLSLSLGPGPTACPGHPREAAPMFLPRGGGYPAMAPPGWALSPALPLEGGYDCPGGGVPTLL